MQHVGVKYCTCNIDAQEKYNVTFKNNVFSVSSLSNWKRTCFSGKNQFLGFGYFLCLLDLLIFITLSFFTTVPEGGWCFKHSYPLKQSDKQTHVPFFCTILGKTDSCTYWMILGVVIELVCVRHQRKYPVTSRKINPVFQYPRQWLNWLRYLCFKAAWS